MPNELLCVSGIDEAGRGAIAGPVYAAAVIIDSYKFISGLKDSKLLTSKKRNLLSDKIKRYSLDWFVAKSSVEEIDNINILNATLLAMRRAIDGLKYKPNVILIDGLNSPSMGIKTFTIVKGDNFVPLISAASILAKTSRDDEMINSHYIYKDYHFDKHKGYGTHLHINLLKLHGPSPIHRKSFAPIKFLYKNEIY